MLPAIIARDVEYYFIFYLFMVKVKLKFPFGEHKDVNRPRITYDWFE